ncbi:MAG: J domain-containing protein [Hyphomonadaceae bacterium]
MLPVLLILAGLFLLLFVFRLSAARRAALLRHWPVAVLAGAAIWSLLRGAIWPAFGLGGLAVGLYAFEPALRRWLGPPRGVASSTEDPDDAEARTILGVGPAASDAEIRAAYRARMSQAHPDRGGKHAEAARLTAARDRLLKKRR